MPTPTKELLTEPLAKIGDTPVSISTVITIVVIIVGTFIAARLIQAAIRRTFAKRGVERSGAAGLAGRLLYYVTMVTGVAIALQTAGIKLGALFAAGAVFAVGIGFAMQNIVQNFVSGVILLVERSIKPGDIIEVSDMLVRVKDMGIRTTLVRTMDDEDMVVPNATLVQSTVKNFTLHDTHYRLRVVVGVTYDSDMALVRRTLETVAQELEWRVRDAEPLVLMHDFGSSSVDWEVSVWTDDPWRHRRQRSRLREDIWNAFKKEEIVIAFPQLDVHFDPPVTDSIQRLSRAA